MSSKTHNVSWLGSSFHQTKAPICVHIRKSHVEDIPKGVFSTSLSRYEINKRTVSLLVMRSATNKQTAVRFHFAEQGHNKESEHSQIRHEEKTWTTPDNA